MSNLYEPNLIKSRRKSDGYIESADLAYLTDLHFSINKKQPKWFGGQNFFENQIERLKEAIQLSNSKGCKVLILGGDIFDSHDDFSPEMCNSISKAFGEFNGLILSVIGNHDLYGRVLDGLENSAIELLELKCLNFSTESTYVEGLGYIELYHWGCSEESRLQKTKKFYREKEDAPVFGAIHSAVGPHSEDFCLGVDELDISGFQILFFGDQHEGWSPRIIRNSIVANPGSFSWMSIKELHRTPRIGFWSNELGVYWEEPLSNPPIKEFEHKKITKFIKSVKDFTPVEIKSLDYDELIKKVCSNKTYSQEAIECLLTEISQG